MKITQDNIKLNRNSQGQAMQEPGEYGNNVYLADCPFLLGKENVEFFKIMQKAKETHTIKDPDEFIKVAKMTESIVSKKLDKLFETFNNDIQSQEDNINDAINDISDWKTCLDYICSKYIDPYYQLVVPRFKKSNISNYLKFVFNDKQKRTSDFIKNDFFNKFDIINKVTNKNLNEVINYLDTFVTDRTRWHTKGKYSFLSCYFYFDNNHLKSYIWTSLFESCYYTISNYCTMLKVKEKKKAELKKQKEEIKSKIKNTDNFISLIKIENNKTVNISFDELEENLNSDHPNPILSQYVILMTERAYRRSVNLWGDSYSSGYKNYYIIFKQDPNNLNQSIGWNSPKEIKDFLNEHGIIQSTRKKISSGTDTYSNQPKKLVDLILNKSKYEKDASFRTFGIDVNKDMMNGKCIII